MDELDLAWAMEEPEARGPEDFEPEDLGRSYENLLKEAQMVASVESFPRAIALLERPLRRLLSLAARASSWMGPSAADAAFYLAEPLVQLYCMEGRFEDALRLVRELQPFAQGPGLEDNLPDLTLLEAQTLLAKWELAAAKELLEHQAPQLASLPGSHRLWLQLAQLCIATGEYAAASECLKHVEGQDALLPSVYWQQLFASILQDDHRSALEAWAALTKKLAMLVYFSDPVAFFYDYLLRKGLKSTLERVLEDDLDPARHFYYGAKLRGELPAGSQLRKLLVEGRERFCPDVDEDLLAPRVELAHLAVMAGFHEWAIELTRWLLLSPLPYKTARACLLRAAAFAAKGSEDRSLSSLRAGLFFGRIALLPAERYSHEDWVAFTTLVPERARWQAARPFFNIEP